LKKTGKHLRYVSFIDSSYLPSKNNCFSFLCNALAGLEVYVLATRFLKLKLNFMKKLILALVSLFCFANAFAQTQPLNTQSISIFKNGQAFYIKNGVLKPTNGKFLLPDPAPQALYGTLWFNSPDGSLARVASYPDTLREQKTEAAVVVWDLLRNNIGKTIGGVLDEKNSVTGKIISVSPMRKDERGEPIYGPESLVTLQSQQGGWTTIPAGQIRYVSFLEQPNLDVSMPKVTPRNLIELSFSNKKAEQPFDMMYLANGLNWAPEYLLELAGENAGTLTLQGEVANEGEDINDALVNLVVGVPNFKFANSLALFNDFTKTNYSAASHDINPNAHNMGISNALMSQQIGYDNEDPTLFNDEGIEGDENEDLFFYPIRNFSLPKGGRSIQPIFDERVALKHIYECDIPDDIENSRAFESEFIFSAEKNKILHMLQIENTTDQPWTTASIMITNSQGQRRPVSQDILTYTPRGGKCFVKLTEALDIKVEQAEREVSRQNAAIQDKGRYYTYDLVQMEGKIKVKNFKNKKLDLRLNRTIVGILKETNISWSKEEIKNPDIARNQKTKVTWETSIGANSTLEITYSYEVYVRI
jgi:hypothetical protein